MKLDEEKLRDKVAEILLSPQKNGQLDRIIDAVYEAMDKQRTSAQNRALHKDCEIIAEKLNDAGYDMKKVVKVDIPWTTTSVKDFIWRPVMKNMFGITSTTDLKKSDNKISEIHEVVMRELGEKLHIEYHEFPFSIEKRKEYEQQMMS